MMGRCLYHQVCEGFTEDTVCDRCKRAGRAPLLLFAEGPTGGGWFRRMWEQEGGSR